jgi:hypothetical protein
MTVSSWDKMTEQLADRLPWLELDDVIILGAPGNRYTQIVQLEDKVAVSAVSNAFLPPDGQLTAEQEQQLQALGWQPPNTPFRQHWWHEVEQAPLYSEEAARIAELMVSTLRDVYRVASPADIELDSFNA